MGFFDFLTGDARQDNEGAGGAPAAGPEAGPSQIVTPSDRADARREQEDKELDEYGLHKPAVPWTQRLPDLVAPPEVMNDPDASWGDQIMRGLAAGPAALAGHFMDQLSPVNTRGEWHVPMPIFGELAEGEERERYQRERAEKEAEQARAEEEDEQLREQWERENNEPQMSSE